MVKKKTNKKRIVAVILILLSIICFFSCIVFKNIQEKQMIREQQEKHEKLFIFY